MSSGKPPRFISEAIVYQGGTAFPDGRTWIRTAFSQLPGGQGSSSGGMREFIVPLARAGVAFGVDALLMEVHDKPAEALSDAANSFDLAELPALLKQLKTIHAVVNNG